MTTSPRFPGLALAALTIVAIRPAQTPSVSNLSTRAPVSTGVNDTNLSVAFPNLGFL